MQIVSILRDMYLLFGKISSNPGLYTGANVAQFCNQNKQRNLIISEIVEESIDMKTYGILDFCEGWSLHFRETKQDIDRPFELFIGVLGDL